MKTVALFCAALLTSAVTHAETLNTAAPLGVELGKTTCARMPSGPNRTKTGTSPWAGGDTIEIRNLERFKLPGLTKATVNCDQHDTVALVTLNFDRSAMDDVVRQLDARYESKRKTDANAENGYAEWAAANGGIEMLYARDGKALVVAYWAKGAKAKYFSYSSTRDKQPPAATTPQGQL